ncbi:MAG: RHS repeat protein [Acidobacteria bacterium]|nr:RHS repeat protein [Acidobacteriota bacterium]
MTLSRQYAGTALSETYQDTTASYDGHGRTIGQKLPQQDSPGTVFTYNPDGSVLTRTDARGVVTNYAYNNRGLVTGITWDVGSTGVTGTAAVGFDYDNLGNRTEMTDGLGTQAYEYDELSRLTAETRSFTDTLANAPLPDNSFRLEYTYHLAGQLKSLKEPFGVTVNYALDKSGRLSGVSPSSPIGDINTFISNTQYRAFGGLKHLEYGNGVEMNTEFNNRLRPDTFTLATSTVDVMEKTYQYYPDGKLKHVDDALNWRFDRLNTYDHVGRIKMAKSSSEANGTEITNGWEQTQNLPYRQEYTYDAFDQMTQRYNLQWGGANTDASYTYANGRVTNSFWTHDADGRVTHSMWPDGPSDHEYDAGGQMVFKHDIIEYDIYERKLWRHYSGDGRELKREPDRCSIPEGDPPPEECEWEDDPTDTMYFIRSTVMGGEVVAEANWTGDKGKRMVLVGGEVIAYLTFRPGVIDTVHFRQTDALGISERVTRSSPENLFGVTINEPNYIDPRHMETDPMGGNVGTVTSHTPVYLPVNSHFPPIEGDSPVYINGQQVRFSLDGVAMSNQVAMAYINSVVIGGANGLSQIIMQHNDAPRLTNIRLKLSDSNTWENWGSNFPGALDRAFANWGIHQMRATYIPRVSWAGVSWVPQQQTPRGPSEPEQQSPPRDPCAGKKGRLNYDSLRKSPDQNGNWTARGHITTNHIDTDETEPDKSKYRSSFVPASRMFNYVTAINQVTFQMATGYRSNNNTIIYIYSIPETPTRPIRLQLMIGTVGTKGPYANKWTNTNTLVLASDCKTVISSYPGLPLGVLDDNGVITGTPVWADFVPNVEIDLFPDWP